MKNNSYPFVSIVVCTFNRSKHISKCLDSLAKQSYPKNRYEVIVVDDGSTDNTADIVQKYPILYLKSEINLGLSAARNKGLDHARGDIYICFDDDCIAPREWLSSLLVTYKVKENIAGVAGVSLLPDRPRILDVFIDSYYMTPAPLTHKTGNSPLERFKVYLNNMINPYKNEATKIVEVYEIYGFSSSFPVSILREVKGWRNEFSGAEDIELCQRIREKYPERKFYCTNEAKLIHDHQLTVLEFLRKPYIRGYVNLKYYLKNSKIPPIFPFPVLYLLTIFLIGLNIPSVILLSIIVIPQMLYFWWPIKAIRVNKIYYLIFPYIQICYEFMVIFGIIRGFGIMLFIDKKFYNYEK